MRYSKVLMTGFVVVMIAALTLTSAGAQAEPPPVGEVEPQDAPIEVDALVVPVSPVNGALVYTRKPVFTFLKNHDAVAYRVQVREFGSATVLYSFTGAGVCTDYVCRLQPDTALEFAGAADAGDYEWHVAYRVGTMWSVYSSWERFFVLAKRFNSTFDLNYKNWLQWEGYWYWSELKGMIWTLGDPDRFNSMYYKYYFPNFDYTVRMKRKISDPGTNMVVVWGNPSPTHTQQYWDDGYYIGYTNNRHFRVWKYVDGVYTTLEYIEDCAAVNPYGWNEVRVVGIYPYLDYWLNGVYLGYITLTEIPENFYLGFDMYSYGVVGDKFFVDWAKASVPDLSAAMLHDPSMELGK